MNIYLAIITTVLVATQIIRIVQNAINLYRNNKVIDEQLKHIGNITDEDLETQKEAYRLIVQHYRTQNRGLEKPLKAVKEPTDIEKRILGTFLGR